MELELSVPIDNDVFGRPATQGQVAGVAINAVIALRSVQRIIREIVDRDNPQFTKLLSELDENIDDLGRKFDALAGWTDK